MWNTYVLFCRLLGLTICLPKCKFGVSQLEFLGHRVSAHGIQPIEKQTSPLQDFPTANSYGRITALPRMINFCRICIKDFGSNNRCTKGTQRIQESPEMVHRDDFRLSLHQSSAVIPSNSCPSCAKCSDLCGSRCF